MRLASAPVVVVIKLVKVVPVYALPASVIQICSLILESIKILCRKSHELFEVRVIIGTRPMIITTTAYTHVSGDEREIP
jgi:hypothetical protein